MTKSAPSDDATTPDWHRFTQMLDMAVADITEMQAREPLHPRHDQGFHRTCKVSKSRIMEMSYSSSIPMEKSRVPPWMHIVVIYTFTLHFVTKSNISADSFGARPFCWPSYILAVKIEYVLSPFQILTRTSPRTLNVISSTVCHIYSVLCIADFWEGWQ